MRSGRSAWLGGARAVVLLLAILLAGAALRWIVMERTFPVRMLGDERYYVNTAINIAQGRGHVFKKTSRLWRPPAHAYLLSRFVDLETAGELDERGDPVDSQRLWQVVHRLLQVEVVLSTLVVAATGLLGWALFGARAGLVAAAIAAVYPNFIAYGHYLWSESLFATLVIGGLAAVVYVERNPRSQWAAAAAIGAVFGAAGLTREIAIAVAGVCAVWWVGRAPPAARRGALARGLLMLALAAAVILPWTVRNYAVHERFVPVSSIGWFAAAQGNALETRDWLMADGPNHVAFEREYFGIAGEMERMDFARAKTLEFVANEQPAWLFKKALLNLALLFSPDSYVLFKIRRGAYPELGPATLGALRAAVIGAYAIVLVIGVLGFFAAPGDGRRRLAGWVVAVAVTVHILANADTRFRLPWMSLFIVYASYALTHSTSVRERLRGRASIAPLAVLAFLFAVCVPYFIEYGGRR